MHLHNVLDHRGVSNTAGTISGVVGVAITGYFLAWNNEGVDPGGWYMALSLASGLCIGGSLVFIRFAKGTILFGSDVDQ